MSRAALICALAAGTIAAGCGGNHDRRSVPARAVSKSASAVASQLTRTCAIPPRVPGKLPVRWKRRSAAIGPIYLYRVGQYRNESTEELGPLPGTNGQRYRGNKQLIFVKSRTAVTLAVAAQDRHAVSLLYNEAPFDNGYALSDGTAAVTFGACGVPITQWSGAFVVAGARCVALVARDQRGVVVGHRRVPYGMRDC